MKKSGISRGDTVTLYRAVDDIWILRTKEEVQALRDADARAGRWHDDGGEPILYGPYGSWSLVFSPDTFDMQTALVVTVTALRPKWLHYRRRPKGLTAGWSETLQRDLLFQRPV
jgi:hypothetical protein